MSGIDNFTSLCLHCDGADGATSFPDSSITPKTVVANGAAQVDTSQFVFGGASYLGDGSSAYLSSADDAAFEFGSGDFTIDCRVRFSALPAATTIFLAKYTTTGAQRCYFWGWDQPSGNMQFRYSNDGASSTLLAQPWSPSTDVWYHVAVVRNGGDLLMFVDGFQIGSTDAIAGALFGGSSDLEIGAFNTGTGGFLDGWLDEIRISKDVARWTANFTPPTAAYTLDNSSEIAWLVG